MQRAAPTAPSLLLADSTHRERRYDSAKRWSCHRLARHNTLNQEPNREECCVLWTPHPKTVVALRGVYLLNMSDSTPLFFLAVAAERGVAAVPGALGEYVPYTTDAG